MRAADATDGKSNYAGFLFPVIMYRNPINTLQLAAHQACEKLYPLPDSSHSDIQCIFNGPAQSQRKRTVSFEQFKPPGILSYFEGIFIYQVGRMPVHKKNLKGILYF